MNSFLKFLLAFLFFSASAASAMAQSGEVEHFTMPKKDGKQGDKTVSGSMLFYDMGGPQGNTASRYAGYTRFVPAQEGKQIRITFTDMDISGDAAVYVYDGDIAFTSYYSSVPDGYMARLDGQSTGSYESTSGSLSVLYYSKGAADGAGWTAEVAEVTPKDMEWVSANAETPTGNAWRGRQAAPLLCVVLETDGSGNPMSCTGLDFTLAGTTDLTDLANVRVIYSKGAKTPAGEMFGQPSAAAAGTISFAGNITLAPGLNYFWLVADIAPDAAAGHLADATLAGVTAGGTERVGSPIAPEGAVGIDNSVRMSQTHTTYSVGPDPVTLYDDGGPEGNITRDFDGMATFRPTTPGSKVKITFTDLNLFNTSSVGYNDVLNVYAGSEKTPEALLASVLDKKISVSSTAADGSLTISLTSVAGTPKPGFTAIVEEFVPVPMTIIGTDVTHPAAGSVCAGTTDVDILLINVKTEGTEPPMTVSEMRFANPSQAPLTRASLHHLGISASATPSLAGECADPQSSFIVKLAEPVALKERDNWFLLRYDVADNSADGQSIDAAITAIGTQAVDNGDPEGDRRVENTYLSATGKFTKTVYGEWRFRNTPSTSSYYGYDDTAGSQQTTFLPGTPGKVVEIDFTQFKLMTSSYLPSPTFVIYDGKDTTAPVLWRAESSTMTTGPQRALRATNTDGALTVAFDANGGRGSQGYGFAADVCEYASMPMTVQSVEVSQLSDGVDVKPGTRDLPILKLRMKTSGDQNPLTLDKLALDLKKGFGAVGKVKLYATGRSEEFGTSSLVATSVVGEQTVTLVPSPAYAMPEKTSFLWVAFDMADSFASDMPVDAMVTGLELGGQTTEVTDPDPDGEAVTKNIYHFEGGDKTLTVNGSMLFFDNGGPDGKYTTEASGTLTFMPAAPGEVIRMTVKDFWTNYQDYLYIYDGAQLTADSKEVYKLSGSKKAEDVPVIISKSEDGALTVVFKPKKNNINNGWEILIESFVPSPMKVSGVEVTPVNDLKMLRGSADNKLLKLAVKVEGEKGSVKIEKLDFSALDSDTEAISRAKVWYTADIDSYDTDTLYGEAADQAPFSFAGDISYDTAGTYYYWLAYDIDSEAANDSKVQARFLSLTAGDTELRPESDKDVLVTVQDGMHGTYTVGTSGEHDFNSITEAIDAMTGGIDGPVVFELADGNYNELVTIPEVTGSSELNTVTLRSASGNRDNVIIRHDTYRDPGSSAYDKRYGVVTFDGIDHFTLENVTVTTTATNFPGLVFLREKSEHVTLRGCAIKAAKSTDSAKGSYLVYQYSKSEANRNNNHMTVEGCLLDGGYIGVGLTGTSTIALPKQRGGTVRDNVFRNQGSKAIYLNLEEDATICGNDIYADGEITSSYNAMDLSDAGGNLNVYGNVIRIKDTSGSYTPSPTAMYIRGYNIDKVKPGTRRVFNNEINMTGCPGGNNTAIRVNTDIPGLELVNNSVRIAAATETGERVYGIYMAGGMKGGRIVNNLIQCETPGYAIYVQRRNYLQDLTLSNNVMWTDGEKFGYIGADPNATDTGFTAGDKTFGEFCADAPMTGSYEELTEFLSDNVLEPAAAGSLVDALPVSYVDTDLYGAERSQTPTIGAYEYAESTVAPDMADGYPQVKEVSHESATVMVKSSLTGVLHYAVFAADAETPDAASVKNEDLEMELRKNVEAAISIEGLRPDTSYRLYAVLSSLRGLDSEVIASEVFTTTYEPTRVATFEDATEDGARLLDGTMSFTGFSVTDITDGVAPAPNGKAAMMDDEYAVIQLLNADDLSVEGFFIRNTAPVTITAKDSSLKPVKTSEVPAHESWTYVDLLPMGGFTYLELESEGDVLIDNFGAKPLDLLVSIDHDEDTAVKAGETFAMQALTDGGVPPFSFAWTDAMHQEAGQGQTLSFAPEASGSYTVTATDSRGTQASATVKVRVLGEQKTATFDDLWLATDSHWCGDVDDEDYMSGSFFSGSFEFNNNYMADWDSWSFFGYANHTSTSFSTYVTDQWNSAVGHGADDSANYGILFVSPFMGKSVMTLTNTETGESIPGMYVTNSAWVVDAILNGDGMEDKFAEGDLLTLKLTGVKADGSTSTLELPLADYRAEAEADRWYLDTWQWVDLSPLGEVKSVEWDMTSTKANAYGMTTPAYVCLDNIGASRPVTEAEPLVLKVNDEEPSATFGLEPYFSFDTQDGTVAYDIECDSDKVSLTDDNVAVSAAPGEELEIVAHATQRGKHEWVRIPVTVESKPLGIGHAEIAGVAVYPNPADSYVNVNADTDSYEVAIISMDGRTLLSEHGLAGKQTIDVSALGTGNYLVRIIAKDGLSAVRKLMIRH